MRQTKYAGIVLALAVCVGTTGCKTNIVQADYKLLGSYAVALETGADLAENPSVPTSVVDKIHDGKNVASPVVKTFHEALSHYADLKAQIDGIKAAGGTPSEQMLSQAGAALGQLQDAQKKVTPLITALVKTVKGF
jgi:hypothetical protein